MSNPRIPYQLSNQRKPITGPDGKSLIVHIVVNIENWQYERGMPRKILPAPHGVEKVPDVPNFSWAEYGMRCGMPRILRLLDERGLPASASINAGVIDAYPACAEAILSAGWEFIGHGIHQRAVQDQDDEEELIKLATEKIERFTGVKPRGWLGPGLQETFKTPDLLKKTGYDYVCDWILDDLPCWMETQHGPMVAMPYSLDINDSVIYAVEKHSSAEMYQRVRDAVEALSDELADRPYVMTLALHPHLIGASHRIGYLARMLDLLQGLDYTVFMKGGDICDWYIKTDPPPAAD